MWLCLLLCWNPGDTAVPFGPLVLPWMLDDGLFEPGDDIWLQVIYSASPAGDELFYEPGEKVWWIQDKPVMVLGATGMPLPKDVTRRATVWVTFETDDQSFGPYELFPRRDAVTITSKPEQWFEGLKAGLPGVDASYLAQVAHFMVGNLSSLDVQGTSYSISGVGPVIDSDGDWIGGRLEVTNDSSCVYVGLGAGSVPTTTGIHNVGVGINALEAVTEGSWNTGVGYKSLAKLTIGNSNTAVGESALENAVFALANTAVGENALRFATSGTNACLGARTLESLVDGTSNTALGSYALNKLVSADMNVAVGHSSLNKNLAGGNTAVGAEAMRENTTGGAQVAIGSGALRNNTTGFKNTAVGFRALHNSISSHENTAVGFEALFNDNHLSYLSGNTAVGYQALNANTSGYGNVAMGHHALRFNVDGYMNIAVGKNALYSNTTGYDNVGLGSRALYKMDTAYSCTAVGSYALYENISGSNNTALGSNAGPGSMLSNLSNTTALGYGTDTTASNQVRVGGSSITSIGGQVSWTTLSDGRFKEDVTDEVPGLDFVRALRPVSYRINRDAVDAFLQIPVEQRQKRETALSEVTNGFIAQDVAKLAEEMGIPFSGVDKPPNDRTPFGLRYAEFVVPLVKAVQQQQEQIEAMAARIEQLELELAGD
ncbi:MAG: tail fiber domain-containing protein [Acidobacteria bacterium]|nr:tail fiber domain-containing protein [Acidobacteriota bacterium]